MKSTQIVLSFPYLVERMSAHVKFGGDRIGLFTTVSGKTEEETRRIKYVTTSQGQLGVQSQNAE